VTYRYAEGMPEDDQQAACEARVALRQLDQQFQQKEVDFDLLSPLGIGLDGARRVIKVTAEGQGDMLNVVVGDELTHVHGKNLIGEDDEAVKEALDALRQRQHEKCTFGFNEELTVDGVYKLVGEDEVTRLGDEVESGILTDGNYSCGSDIVAPNGKAYIAPVNATKALCIDLVSGEVKLIGDKSGGEMSRGGDKYKDTVLGNDGKLYGIPAGSSSRVMCIDPNSDTYTLMGGDLKVDGGGPWKWYGGVRANDGRIFGIPAAADKVLCINPANETVAQVGPSLGSGEVKWQGGVLAHDGNIYCMPGNAKKVLCINPSKKEVIVTEVGDDLGSAEQKWLRGCCAANGMVFGFPKNASQVTFAISKHEHRT
jgi:outer membrane protein assembly factor BamB